MYQFWLPTNADVLLNAFTDKLFLAIVLTIVLKKKTYPQTSN
jgi:hypothetical protein